MPDLDLPALPEIARRPPALSMDQYFLLNEDDRLNIGPNELVPGNEKCTVPFEL